MSRDRDRKRITAVVWKQTAYLFSGEHFNLGLSHHEVRLRLFTRLVKVCWTKRDRPTRINFLALMVIKPNTSTGPEFSMTFHVGKQLIHVEMDSRFQSSSGISSFSVLPLELLLSGCIVDLLTSKVLFGSLVGVCGLGGADGGVGGGGNDGGVDGSEGLDVVDDGGWLGSGVLDPDLQ